jgi:hypothetical protein
MVTLIDSEYDYKYYKVESILIAQYQKQVCWHFKKTNTSNSDHTTLVKCHSFHRLL